jgi:hypothetical protein
MFAFAQPAHAQAECERNFREGPSVVEGVRTIVMTSVGLEAMPRTAAVDALRKKGLGEGWSLEFEKNIEDLAPVSAKKSTYDLY